MNVENDKTKLQIEFEEQTPTIAGCGSREYLQVFCSWLHFQVEASDLKIIELKGEIKSLKKNINKLERDLVDAEHRYRS